MDWIGPPADPRVRRAGGRARRRLPPDRPDRREDPRGRGLPVAVRDLCGRIESSLAGATARIDQSATTSSGRDAIGDTLTAATDAVERYLDEARALKRAARPPSTIRDDLVADLERAGRALAMVEHGTTIMTSVRGGNRELEAQTSIKRGYLNLIHARERDRGRQAEPRRTRLSEPPDPDHT